MDSTNRRRITVKFKSANPLFEQWLKEWEDKAKSEGSKSHHTFNKALNYLRKCPIPLNTGKECLILKGFGEKLCKMLDQKLQDHYKLKDVHSSPNKECSNIPQSPSKIPELTNTSEEPKMLQEGSGNSTSSSDGSLVEYVPMPATGEYVILLALYRKQIQPDYLGYATKEEIISEALLFSDISFTKFVKGTKSTPWIARKTLISKKLLTQRGKPSKYSLTNSGFLLAGKLYNKELSNKILRNDQHFDTLAQHVSNVDDIIILDDFPLENYNNDVVEPTSSKDDCSGPDQCPSKGLPSQKTISKHPSTNSTSSIQSQSQECVIFQPASFDIILYVDTAETTGNNSKSKSDAFLAELGTLLPADKFEVKHLSIGDYIWICRQRSTGEELVLPFVVERKRLDDLAASIRDGRYREQKFRLKRSGVPTIVYLIERGAGGRPGLPVATLMQAASNTAVRDGFVVHATGGAGHTAAYLGRFTGLLTDRFKDKTVMSCSKENLGEIDLDDDLIPLMTFKEFNQSSMKNKPMKVTDLFVKMLLQLKGVSVDKALAIVENYPTPQALRKAYMENSGVKGEKLLAPIKFGRFKKAIGHSISKTIYQLFTFESF